MKRMLTTSARAGAGRLRSPSWPGGRGSTDEAESRAPAATFVFAARVGWTADYGARPAWKIAYSPVGSGAGIAAITARQVEFGASDAPLSPDQFNACNGACRSRGRSRGRRSSQPVGRPEQPAPDRPGAGQHLPGHHRAWDDPAIKALNPKGQPAVDGDHAGVPLGQLRNDIRLHRLPVGREPHLEEQDRRSASTPTGPRASGGRGSVRRLRRRLETNGAIGYTDVAFRDQEPAQVHGDEEQRRQVHDAGPARRSSPPRHP